MWITGNINLNRTKSYEHNGFTPKGKMRWNEKDPYGKQLEISAFSFAYALMRASVVGSKMSVRECIASSALALSSMAYMEKMKGTNFIHLHSSFKNTKDFVGTGYKGVIGSAFAYLEMLNSGHIWLGHWEDCAPLALSKLNDPHPDFVFSDKLNVCVVDAKGTASSSASTNIKSDWKRQIYPYLGQKLAMGGKISRGMIIATTLNNRKASVLLRARGEIKSILSSSKRDEPEDAKGAIETVQRSNFIDIFKLIGYDELSTAMMLGPESLNSKGVAFTFQIHAQPKRIFADYQIPFLIGSDIWTIRPFCTTKIIHEVLEKFVATDNTSTEPLSTHNDGITIREYQNTYETNGKPGYILEGPDGAGALFQKCEMAEFSTALFS